VAPVPTDLSVLPGSGTTTRDTGRVARHWSPDLTFSVLFVCTGNICRSAMAERLARAVLDESLGGDAGVITVHSAGTQAVVGSAVHPDSALVLAGFGGDPAGFVARQLVDDMVIDADLTLTLTRTHRRAVLKAAPRALSRTFTLREAASLVDLVGADADLSAGTYADRCRVLVKAMAAARSKRTSDAADDIADPIGHPVQVHQEVGEAIVQALLPVFGRIVSLRTSGTDDTDGSGGPSALSLVG
jgi:protein-tyrosine-phosphatase